MARPIRICALGLTTLLCLAGCSTYITEQRPAWRAEAENACLARNVVQESSFIRASTEINGPGICGLTHPFKLTALADGSVALNSTATLGCPMIAALDTWIKEVVQPAAQARFGEPVVRINSMGSYSCRGINNMSGAKLSEHGFGNAIDVGSFVLASGRELNILRGFNGSDEQEQAFLHEAHAGACGYFTTVLGPGYNSFHRNHFHLDLAMHGSTSRGPRRYCKPVPEKALPEPPKRDNLPDPPPIEEELDIARAPAPAPSVTMGRPSLLASAPSSDASASRAAAYAPPLRRHEDFVAARRSEPAGSPRDAVPPIVTFSEVGDNSAPAEDLAASPGELAEPRRTARRAGAGSEPNFGRAPDVAAAREDAGPSAAAPPDADSDGSAQDAVPSEPAAPPKVAVHRSPRTLLEGATADWDATSSIR